jgi:uncharacterized protein (TIGR03083 family)
MYSDADRAKIVQAEAKRLEQFLCALSPENWQRPSACDQWQIADVVAHLTGMRIAETITRGLQGDVTPPEGRPPVGALHEDAFREYIAQGSIAFRERVGDQLLSAFMANNAQLAQVLAGLAPHDWETRGYHPMGPEPVRTLIDMRITELAMHGWDIRSRFDPQATLSTDSLPALCNTIPRAVRRAFRPEASRSTPVRYRFVVTEPVAVRQDIVLSREGGRCESASNSKADVTFQCTAATYVLVMFGRCTVEAALRDGRLSYEGEPGLVAAFGRAFVGG